ncbi:hypothetical protein OUZ56_009612 [Daphnia magna]|uniref:Uncharacterized protein n=1 Tax=Daphnia magna TaxID=35525 RepID=A0ABR0AGJ3_9CRUS|nr:hypothetical protein OUZ56_009612 [Daphnia magna]
MTSSPIDSIAVLLVVPLFIPAPSCSLNFPSYSSFLCPFLLPGSSRRSTLLFSPLYLLDCPFFRLLNNGQDTTWTYHLPMWMFWVVLPTATGGTMDKSRK